MPSSAKQTCAQAGCGVLLTRGEGRRCPAHAVGSDWNKPRREVPRIRGGKLLKLRKELFDHSPLCVTCERFGRVTIATIRDHIVPLAEGGTEDAWNTQALCWDCNERKRIDESKRGKRNSTK
jgi:5-methylcytosine-specific restriction enzyme A